MSVAAEVLILRNSDVGGCGSSEGRTRAEAGDPLAEPRWDAWVADFDAHQFFHTSAWLRVLRGAYGFRVRYLGRFQGAHPVALVPVMEVDGWLGRTRGVALPFSDATPILARTAESARQLWEDLVQHGKQRRWDYLECRGGMPRLPGAIPSRSCRHHVLDLGSGEQQLWEGCEGSVRRAIRKAQRAGLRVELGTTPKALREFYGLHVRTRARHGTPPQPFSFFEAIDEHVVSAGRGWVVLAWHGHRPVAGAVFFHVGTRALYKFGASDERWQHLRPNNLVMWEAIRRYERDGFVQLDFGRTALLQEGLRRFKASWGARESTLDYYRYDLNKDVFVVERDRLAGWPSRLVARLPLTVARWMGACLYRHGA